MERARLCWEAHRGLGRLSSHGWEAASSAFRSTDTFYTEKLLHTEGLGQDREMLKGIISV